MNPPAVCSCNKLQDIGSINLREPHVAGITACNWNGLTLSYQFEEITGPDHSEFDDEGRQEYGFEELIP